MGRFEDEVVRMKASHRPGMSAGMRAPEQEGGGPLVEPPDQLGSQLLPPHFRVGPRLSLAHGQHIIQQQDTLSCPVGQVA